jgi:hypothetical protein
MKEGRRNTPVFYYGKATLERGGEERGQELFPVSINTTFWLIPH